MAYVASYNGKIVRPDTAACNAFHKNDPNWSGTFECLEDVRKFFESFAWPYYYESDIIEPGSPFVNLNDDVMEIVEI